MMKEKIGAVIERGQIQSVEEGGSYKVASIDRDGIVTPAILPINDTDTYTVGVYVYFFVFNDGTGRIICSI